MSDKPMQVLFLCTGNACRSQMAEGWARHLGGGRINAVSAGVEAHGLDQRAVAAMREAGVDISDQRSTALDPAMLAQLDLVVTVCDNARERMPSLPPGCRHIHWPLPDPAKAKGSGAEVQSAFVTVRDQIKEVVRQLMVLADAPGGAFPARP